MRKDVIHRCLLGVIFVLPTLMISSLWADELTVDLLVYRVERPGDESYINRMLVTSDYLRIDQGEQDAGFILFDRKQRVIYSVNPLESSILVIDPQSPVSQVEDLRLELVSSDKHVAPNVAGAKPQYWRLTVNGASCRDAFVLPSTMPESVEAYREYLNVLATQQAVALSALPEEFQDHCDSAVHAYAPDAFLQKGLPLKVWDGQGYSEALLDFRHDFKVSSEHFTLPEFFRRVPMGFGG
ncbi:MAG: UDP-2,3-diacylglucosamine hydrolase [Candidatus Thiodiazotropha sp. (ex Monitilora ramsayi)]|nr:UDP-2,3-diacylglucosamine hydrolase [Candidatus Thiodiazotropha sp. (ex Monitilora ramsayi)]